MKNYVGVTKLTDYVEVTKLMESTPDEEVIEIGKKYEVLYSTLSGVYIYANKAQPKYFLYNNQFKYSFESNKEEKEVKYTEKDLKDGMKLRCTKSIPERWTIGKLYDITLNEDYNSLQILDNEGYWAFTDYILDCLNGNRSQVSFEIIEEEKEMKKKYELVEKEYPVATFKVDVKEVIQAKIDELRTEAEYIANKRNRMELQMFNLNSKANKLEEVIETIKEFE